MEKERKKNGKGNSSGMSELQRKTLEKYGLQNRTKEERTAIAKKAVETKRRKKEEKMQLQKCMRTLLSMRTHSEKQNEVLKKFGFSDEELNNKTLLMVALYQKGVSGDVQAIKEIIQMMEKLDMFDEAGRVQSNITINLLPVGESYEPNEQNEKEIWDAQNNSEWMEEENTEWDDPFSLQEEEWGSEVYDG